MAEQKKIRQLASMSFNEEVKHDAIAARIEAKYAARIAELEAVIKLVDDDVRCHLRSDVIAPALLRSHAVKAVREALNKTRDQADIEGPLVEAALRGASS